MAKWRKMNVQALKKHFDLPNINAISKLKQSDNNSSIIVDVNTTTEFTSKHLDKLKEIINTEAWPELYGEELPDTIQFIGFDTVSIDSLSEDLDNTFGSQTPRATDNPQYDNIKNDIITNGYKLRYPPAQVRVTFDENGNEKLNFINGRTRAKILKYHTTITNMIVAKYEVKNNKALLTQGLKFNCTGVPEGVASSADIISVATQLIFDGSLKKTYKAIKEWLYDAVGNGPFTEAHKEHLVVSIFNNSSFRPVIYSWRPETIGEWMSKHNFIKANEYYKNIGLEKSLALYVDILSSKEDQNKYLYFVMAHSSPAKNLWRVARLLSMNFLKGKTLRLIIHTSTLTGSHSSKDLKEEYFNRIETHNSLWKLGLSNFAEAFFCDKKDKAPKVNTDSTIYASLPAIASEHSMDELVLL
jgi:hypothetical protein